MLKAVDACLVLSNLKIKLFLGGAVDEARPALGCLSVSDLLSGSKEDERPIREMTLGLIFEKISSLTAGRSSRSSRRSNWSTIFKAW